jgi:hypothetical protein
MPELGPIAPILGGVVGALIAATVSYFFVFKRRRVVFWIQKTRNLTDGMKPFVAVAVEGSEVVELNRASVMVENSGNAALKDFEFEVRIPGHHGNCVAKAESSNPLLERAVSVGKSYSSASEILVKVVVPFFNPKETFEVVLFFDNEADECEVRCRMEETTVTIRRGLPRSGFEELAGGVAVQFVSVGIALIALMLSLLVFLLAKGDIAKSIFERGQ